MRWPNRCTERLAAHVPSSPVRTQLGGSRAASPGASPPCGLCVGAPEAQTLQETDRRSVQSRTHGGPQEGNALHSILPTTHPSVIPAALTTALAKFGYSFLPARITSVVVQPRKKAHEKITLVDATDGCIYCTSCMSSQCQRLPEIFTLWYQAQIRSRKSQSQVVTLSRRDL